MAFADHLRTAVSFILFRLFQANEPDAVRRVDIRAESETAVAKDTANWVQRQYVQLPERYKQALHCCVSRVKQLTVSGELL